MKVFSSIPTEWDGWMAQLPGAHLLQTAEWAQTKADVGWQALPVIWQNDDGGVDAAAMVLERSVRLFGRLRLRILYVPRGPLLDWSNLELRRLVLDDLQKLAKERGAIFIKIDPDVLVGTGIPGSDDARENLVGKTLQTDLALRGWLFSADQVQFRNTVKIDVTQTEEEIMARMKQKTRYNLRLAQRK
ncbi:MAG: peptidoglycan bridge formation glycyltransferase FemA/FemB family protein, partial [Anaerolineaceae bacterium]